MDELDAWVIYGRIADATLAIESLVYTPPFGDMAFLKQRGKWVGDVCSHHEKLLSNYSALTWDHFHQANQTQSVAIIHHEQRKPGASFTHSVVSLIPPDLTLNLYHVSIKNALILIQ